MDNANVADISAFEQLQIDQNNRTNISQMTMFNNKDTAVNNAISIDPNVSDRLSFINAVKMIDELKMMSPKERREKGKGKKQALHLYINFLTLQVAEKENALVSMETAFKKYDEYKAEVPLMKKELAKLQAYMKESRVSF
jgi:hypothetical protein